MWEEEQQEQEEEAEDEEEEEDEVLLARCFPFDVDRNLVCGFAYYSFIAVSCVLSFVCCQRYAIPQEE